MKGWAAWSVMLACATVPAWGAANVAVQDFEKAFLRPTVWVVNVPFKAFVSRQAQAVWELALASGAISRSSRQMRRSRPDLVGNAA